MKTTVLLYKNSNYVTSIRKIPLASWSRNNFTICLGMVFAAASQFVANVRGHTNELVLITMSWGLVNVSFSLPFPLILNFSSLTNIVHDISDLEFCKSDFRRSGMSLQAQFALTPMMQSPLSVRFACVVISIVLDEVILCFHDRKTGSQSAYHLLV